jgi:hypothetical protein
MITAQSRRARGRAGITLTEILIAILILGVGMVSLATLFPIALLRLRDAARYSRSTYLGQAAEADLSSRGLLTASSFVATGSFYTTSGYYVPLIQDTPAYKADWAAAASGAGAYAGGGGLGTATTSLAYVTGTTVGNTVTPNANYPSINGPGLPFAYDPLWRYQTISVANGTTGYYLGDTFEARFGAGLGFIQNDPDGNPPSAHGLPRLSNFTATMLSSAAIPGIFVSPEDVVWQETNNQQTTIAGNSITLGAGTTPAAIGAAPSPVLPDLSISRDTNNNPTYQPVNDFHYSWMFTGQLINSSNQGSFDGNIVVFENRPFGISQPATTPNPPGNPFQTYQVDGEFVVEAIFGHSANILPTPGGAIKAGYGVGANRTVLLRWYASQPDPIVKVGDWIADVTYERVQSTVQSRWWGTSTTPNGVGNPTNNGEWDNLPAQRCYWYQVQKVQQAIPDPYLGVNYRSMVVYVSQTLQSRTLLTAVGTPAVVNAALIAPSVVNVIPTTVFVR